MQGYFSKDKIRSILDEDETQNVNKLLNCRQDQILKLLSWYLILHDFI